MTNASSAAGAPPESPLPGWRWLRICDTTSLAEGGEGQRFAWRDLRGAERPGFLVRFEGTPQAYVNACRHVAVELDFPEGRFFDDTGLYLVCSTHGAMYDAGNGHCVAGPCAGEQLERIESCEHDGGIWVLTNGKGL